jgi:hypothetical protein
MDPRFATKTPVERQEEEADRHIRPAPKQKPPRQDLRRNQDHAESNPDADDASDRKDRSTNYKNVGGSLTQSVVRRFLARRPQILIPAKSRETGKTVMISPKTLKTQPGKYTPLDPKENPKDNDDAGSFRYPDNPADFKPAQPKPQKQPPAKEDVPEKNEGDFYYPDPPKSRFDDEPEEVEEPEESEEEGKQEEPEAEAPEDDEPEDDEADEEDSDEAEEPKAEDWKAEPEEKTEGDKPEAKEEPKPEPEKPVEEPKAQPEGKPKEAPKGEAPPAPEPPEAKQEPKAEPQPEAPKEEPQEAPKAEPKPKAPKKPKKPKKAPEDKAPEDKPDAKPEDKAEAKPVSESAKAGIAPPKRPEPSRMQQREAATLLVNTFPPDVAANIMAAQLHPDDVYTMVRKYNAAKAGLKIQDASEFAAKMAGIYQTDPNQIPPPSKWKGQSFDNLSPEEQSEANRQHQLQVMAMSLAAHEGLTNKLANKGVLSGKPQVPPAIASNLASVMLSPRAEEHAGMLADKTFNEALERGQTLKMSDGAIKRLMASVKGSAAATGVAKAFLQANDYQTAKAKFLDSGNLSEWDTPNNIFREMKNASRFFEQRNALYGDETTTHPAGSLLRMRILSRLKSLSPKRYQMVQAAMPKLEESEYKRQMKAWGPKFKDWETRKEAHEAALEQYSKNPKGEPPGAFNEPEPAQPRKPVSLTDDEDSEEDVWKALYSDGNEPEKPQPEEKLSEQEQESLNKATDDAWEQAEADTKKAAAYRGFTYPSDLVMASADKTSVYHGIDPYAYGPASYPGWLQAHQRDLNDSDFGIIEASAKDWLKSELLTTASQDMLEDARLRMALDLAIYNSPYNGAINPNNYDLLLTRIGGTSSISVRNDADTSSFRTATGAGGEKTMKASNQVRAFAAKVANTDSKLAYEMLDFADRLAEDEEKGQGMPPWLKDKVEDKKEDKGDQSKEAATDKFATLRSEVIKAASAVPADQRGPWMPILKAIKTLG